jgi:nucleoside-diphosphate-sugar epimerase
MRVLVTGGGGFLGSAICRQLLQRGDEAVAYQRRPAPGIEALGGACVRGDLLDRGRLVQTARACDAVLHTAGKAGVWGSYASYHEANVTGTENVIAACRENGIGLLVHTSSPSVVHGGGDIEGGDESLPYPERFLSPYPATKAQGERLVLAANGESLRTLALRPHLIWGPGDPHLLPRLVHKARGGRLALPGASRLIDTIYVDNAAHAHLLGLDRLRGGGACCGRTYFVTNGEPLPQGRIIRGLLEAAGLEVRIREVPPALAKTAGAVLESAWKLLRIGSEPPLTRWSAEQLSTSHWYDISAARRDLGYEPLVSIAEGLALLRKYLQTTGEHAGFNGVTGDG